MKNTCMAVAVILGAVLLVGCGPSVAWSGKAEPTRVVVEDLGKDDDRVIVDAMKEIPGVKSVKVEENRGGRMIVVVEHDGSACTLPPKISKAVAAPELRPGTAEASFSYKAFDNKAPDIIWIYPSAGGGEPETVTEPVVDVALDVPDHDVESVKVNGIEADWVKGTVYRIAVPIKEGKNVLVATARDDDGNTAKSEAVMILDTTPPALDARVKIILEGKVEPGSTVLVDGREASVKADGSYTIEVKVKKGQTEIDIVAIDPSGNRTTTKKKILE